jgi:hypothetical protein
VAASSLLRSMHLDSREGFAMSIWGAAYCVHLQEVSEQIEDCSPLSFPLLHFLSIKIHKSVC